MSLKKDKEQTIARDILKHALTWVIFVVDFGCLSLGGPACQSSIFTPDIDRSSHHAEEDPGCCDVGHLCLPIYECFMRFVSSYLRLQADNDATNDRSATYPRSRNLYSTEKKTKDAEREFCSLFCTFDNIGPVDYSWV